jgi:hypothetical protein
VTTTGRENWAEIKSATGLGVYQALNNIHNRSIEQQTWAPESVLDSPFWICSFEHNVTSYFEFHVHWTFIMSKYFQNAGSDQY